MSKKNILIEINNLSKTYDLSSYSLVDFLRFKKHKEKKLTVLDDINLTIATGDKIGLIGRNGAGKSTLLKIISKITYPTKGSVTLYGKVGSVLEAGVGFNQQLTAIENVYLNGSILGMERKEIQKKVNQIIEFSGLSKFKDVPLKKFSTGMQVKIAFSICVFLMKFWLLLINLFKINV